MITLGALTDIPTIRHGFFTRQGGVSTGLYSSLNVGFGSGDDPAAVAENRARAAGRLDIPAERLVTCYQVHSPDVAVVDSPWRREESPHADAMVTRTPGIALGILTADCVPVLFCDPAAGVIGAAHAGWKGAIGGVVEGTIAAMTRLGAAAERIVTGIGPHIGRDSYEVGPEFRQRFLEEDQRNASLFAPSSREDHWMFDIGGYVEARLNAAGVAAVERSPHDTVTDPDRFFSYRRATLRGEPDYGRGLSAIVLAD